MNKTSWTSAAIRLCSLCALSAIVWLGVANTSVRELKSGTASRASRPEPWEIPDNPIDTTETDTTEVDPPIWPNEDNVNPSDESDGIQIPLPDNIKYKVEYNPITGEYELVQTIGDDLDYRPRTTLTLDEYLDHGIDGNISEYWKQIQEEEDEANRGPSKIIKVGGEGFEGIFGSNEIEIRPQGSAELTFGLNISKTDNPRIPIRQRRLTTFDFDQKIQLNVIGNIGTRMKLNVNYNTESTFDFENQMKLEYTGDEDQIIQKIELGNVSLPLQGQLIQGSTSLFGGKVATKWGKLRNTTIFSQQKGERKEINIQGGAQTQNFDITADNYEANRHYFLSGWFRSQYDQAMASLPVVGSGVNVTRIEVWLVNLQSNTLDVRNVVAFADLGEAEQYMNNDLVDLTGQDPSLQFNRGDIAVTQQGNPSNLNNDIYRDATDGAAFSQAILGGTQAVQAITNNTEYSEYRNGTHYEKVNNMRRLNPSEYTYNSRLGFISLKQSLNNAEVLCVAYEYTLNGQTYQVGTISQDGFAAPQSLVLKLLKPSITRVKLDNGQPAQLWDNMMKNVYNLGAFGVAPENFRLDVWYNNPATGVNQNYIPREPLNGKLLLQVLNLDRIDAQQMPYPDAFFDFIPNAATGGGLIDAQAGRVYFPVIEPFGSHLEKKIREAATDPAIADQVVSQVVYQPLYDSTKTAAQILFPNLNRFRIKGQYQSASGSEISLNALNIPQGAVSVTAGGIRLTEGVDYTVDYNLGRVRILNEGVLTSGQPIKVSVESNSLFNLQFRTLLGTRFDYTFNENLTVGATLMNLRERPVTQKVNIGDDPVNNTTVGIDGAFQKEAPFITRLVDGIPFIETKAKSNINFSAEAARIFPGHSRAISKDGNAYVDDFEGSQSVIDLRSLNQWFLASTPQSQPAAFPEASLSDSLPSGYNRAKLSWYVIDPLFFRETNGLSPANIFTDKWFVDHRMREILEGEVFPNRQLPPGTPPNIATLDLTYYPSERGMYNYELPAGSAFSAGLNTDGTLVEPESRWGGIQRSLTTTDFEASNVEFIQFWLMDPFNSDAVEEGQVSGGDLYFNLGNVSEDVLKDDNWTYENGFPSENQPDVVVETSNWGNFPSASNFNVVNAFDNSTGNYFAQDIGMDGLNDPAEQTFFNDWLVQLQGYLNPTAFSEYAADPSADDYDFFRSPEADAASLNTVQRYKNFNNNEGNSNTTSPNGYPIAATTIPNSEDINQDLTLNLIESYFQYKVSLHPDDLGANNIGKNYITDSFEITRTVNDGTEKTIRWYQFKVPVKEFDERIGGIADFRSIRYIRMYLKGWKEPVTLRFARLELVRGEWRKYTGNLESPQISEPTDPEPTLFNIAAVNIEENGNRNPVPYVVPPGIIREQDVASANLRSLNEQSLSYQVCNLEDGDSRAAYRTVNFDMRQYGKLRMFAHAEALGNQADITDKDLTVFVRLGSDFDQNYYEYELPMYLTPWYTGDDEAIWPEANNFEIELAELQNLKAGRPSSHPSLVEYSKMIGSARVSVKGNPNLANVTILMIGVRNPLRADNVFESNDDGLPKCAVIWVNELRMSDFNQKGGWAAVARMNATLADFGTLAVAGNISTPGWGQIEQRVQQRQQETILGLDANSTLQLGKFFPEHWGVSLPMYVGYNEQVRTPKYSPLQPDLVMDDLPNVSRPLRKKSQDYTKRRSINFTNVRISPKKGTEIPEEDKPSSKDEKGGGLAGAGGTGAGGGGEDKPQFYDIENFSVSYSYNELYHRDINIDWRLNKQYKGAFDYAFQNKPKEIKPFAKIPGIKTSKYLKWIKEFNFYPGIKQFGFHTEMNRTYEESRIRNNTLELTGVYSDILIQTQAQKTWNWTRGYTFKYDLTKSLKFDYNATNLALVGEPRGVIDKEDTDWYQAYKDTVWTNIQNMGNTTNFNQAGSLSYKLPFDKFPLIDFISSDARYAATYRWDRAPFTQDSLGNTIQNSRQLTLNGQANFETLYNKSEKLKAINAGKKDKKDDKKPKGKEDPTDKDGFGNDEKKEKEEKVEFNFGESALRFMMMIRNVSGSYTRNEAMLVPGYNRKTQLVGMDNNFEAPGFGFIAGQQNTDIWGNETGENFALNAAENNWLIRLPSLNTQYSETYSETWNYKINLEPIKSFKIELTANRTEGRNLTSFFRLDDASDEYVFDSPMETGNFSASIISWPTAFSKDNPDDGWNSPTFQQFLDNRLTMSNRLNGETYNESSPLANGYFTGWGPTSQDVVIPAFIAAYTGQSVNETSLDVFKTKVRPNWNVTYDGLTKLNAVKKYFKQFNVRHSYKSTVTTSYITNLNYHENDLGLPDSLDQSEHRNFISRRQINTVTITENLVPLSIDMTLKVKKKNNKDKVNEPQVKFEYKRDRTVALGLSNYQITENKSNSITVGLGYKIVEVPNPFGRKKGSKLPIQILKNTNINFRCDLTMRDNVTLIRKMVEEQSQPTAGQRLWSIKSSADMQLSKNLQIRVFYDHQLNKPKISTSFPTSNISTGIALRFNLNND